MDQRRALLEGRLDVAHRRQRLVLDLDRGCGLRRDLGRGRGYRGDDVSLEAHAVPREEATVLREVAVEHVRHVLVGDDGKDARQRPGAGRVDERTRACVWSA